MGKQINRTDIWCNTISYCKKGGIQILQGLIPAGSSRLLYFKYPYNVKDFMHTHHLKQMKLYLRCKFITYKVHHSLFIFIVYASVVPQNSAKN